MPQQSTLCVRCGVRIFTYPSKPRRYCSRACKDADQCKSLGTRGGRIYVKAPDHPRAGKGGWVKRAILILEAAGVCVGTRDVHHRNGIKDDDRPENLVALTRAEHTRLHALQLGLGTRRRNRWPQHRSQE